MRRKIPKTYLPYSKIKLAGKPYKIIKSELWYGEIRLKLFPLFEGATGYTNLVIK